MASFKVSAVVPAIAGTLLLAALSEPTSAQSCPIVTDPTPLNANAAEDCDFDDFAQLATDGEGNWIAIWTWSYRGGCSDVLCTPEIMLARSTDNAVTWSTPALLDSSAALPYSPDNWMPQIVTDKAGTWLAVWSSTDDLGGTIDNDMDILLARSTDDGATWSPPAALNTYAHYDEVGDDHLDRFNDTSPQLAIDSTGDWVAVWASKIDLGGTIGDDFDILFSRSTDGGITWDVPAALNTNAASDSRRDSDPQLATNATGGWVVIWESSDDLGGTIGRDLDILFSRSTDNAVTWSPPAPLNTNAAFDSGSDRHAQFATDRAGHWVVAWFSTDDLGGTIGDDYDVLFSRSADDGLTWTAPAPLNNNAPFDDRWDRHPDLATDGTGNWVAAWIVRDPAEGPYYDDEDIFFSFSMDNGHTWSDPVALNTNAVDDLGDDWFPQVATDHHGNWIVVWSSNDGLGGAACCDDYDILVTHFSRLTDCNGNGVPDECDMRDGTSADCNENGIPDECDILGGGNHDCNGNNSPDVCDIASGISRDRLFNGPDGIPDECQRWDDPLPEPETH
ncbi:MAG: exo-alpha-sialidase [Phycisphaerales bacterium]|nr:MAG: exo-alpha-sialidase [Phycisphaerales bacterium]